MTSRYQTFLALILIAVSTLSLAACSSDNGDSVIKTEAKYPHGGKRGASEDIYEKPASIFGDGGIFGIGSKKADSDDNGSNTGIGVNSFLWRASLDTASFMPIASADPFGGTILTDWYIPDANIGERYKLNIFILDRQLRSDGVRVKAFKQVFHKGTWVDTPPPAGMHTKLEDTILTRARQMRVAQID